MSAKVSQSSEALVKKTRLLLFLWDMGGVEKQIKKGELNERLKRKKETAKHYQDTYEELEKAGAIALSKNTVSLSTPEGLQMLNEGLKSDEFQFDSAIGAKAANALLKWFREQGTSGKGVVSNGASAPADTAKSAEGAIASYDEFEEVALDVYEILNRDYNLDDLVPIYRIRREIGDQVTRTQFDEWLLEMQTNDILQLIGGEMPDITSDKAEDSIKTGLGGVRYYAKRL
jgi:hypothetical protein